MADIVIRGMEMPTEHRTEVLIFKNGFVAYYDVYGHYLGQAKATPLPEGHGRLIDADALRKEFPEPEDWKDFAQAVQHITGIWATIDNAPTIVPAEGGTE